MAVPAIRLLKKFLATHGLRQTDAAEAVRVSDATMHDYIVGNMRPKADVRERFATWTLGAVPEEAWKTAKERRQISVKPFIPPTAAPDEAP